MAQQQKKQHQIERYQAFLAATRGLSFASYDALWQWSVTELDAFWLSLWDFFELHSPTPFERALCEDRMPGAVWFRGAHVVSRVLLVAYCALYVAIAVNYAVANGVDAPAGDLLFAYVGGVVVLALAVIVARGSLGSAAARPEGRPQFG